MDFKDINVSTVIMMMLMVIIIILLISIISKTYQATEKFGAIERKRLLAAASMKSTDYDETDNELVSEAESLNAELSKKEGYVPARGNLLFPGQYDYLINGKKDKPSFRQSNKSIVEEIGDAVKEKVQAIAEQTSGSNIAVDSSVPTELQSTTPEPTTESEYETDKTKAIEPEISNADDVVSGSGNAIESSIPESFTRLRTNTDFGILHQTSTAAKLAQAEDESNQQQSTDMKAFIKNFPGLAEQV